MGVCVYVCVWLYNIVAELPGVSLQACEKMSENFCPTFKERQEKRYYRGQEKNSETRQIHRKAKAAEVAMETYLATKEEEEEANKERLPAGD